jgi:hypothetical protein
MLNGFVKASYKPCFFLYRIVSVHPIQVAVIQNNNRCMSTLVVLAAAAVECACRSEVHCYCVLCL